MRAMDLNKVKARRQRPARGKRKCLHHIGNSLEVQSQRHGVVGSERHRARRHRLPSAFLRQQQPLAAKRH